MRRVVVTGIGAVTPLAKSFRDAWSLVKRGVSGIDGITKCDASDLPWKMAGEVRGFDPEVYFSKREVMRHDPFIQYAVAAAAMAVQDAGLGDQESAVRSQKSDDERKPSLLRSGGVVIGSSRGGIGTIEREITKRRGLRLSPYLMPSTTISMAASAVAKHLGMKGHCLGISNACASGTNAIGEALRLIRHGYAHLVLAGGAEAPLCRICLEGYGSSGALSRTCLPSASRPFDRTRDGFVIAEGACVLVLEDLISAEMRDARMYGEIAGYGNAADAFHMVKPGMEGEVTAMRTALEDADTLPAEVDYISAHGTSTVLGDKTEAAAIKRVFDRAGKIPVSALKSMTGHMLAASGAFEAACTVMSIHEGVIPPTINLEERDPDCDIMLITEKRDRAIKTALSNSFGFGGVNAVLVIRKMNDES